MSAGRNVINSIIIGFALLACFIGAGNLVFTPAIGLIAGREWQLALFGFALPGVLLPVMAFVAVVRAGGTEGVASEMGKTFSILFTTVAVLCTSLLAAAPRAAATIHELGVTAIFGPVPQILTTLVFFAAVLCLSLNPSAVVKIIGKYLAPVLLTIMAAVIVKGAVCPIDIPADTGIPRLFALRSGFMDGYRTMDAFAGLIFSGAIFAAIAAFSANQPNSRAQIIMACGATVVAGLGFLFICGGLIYLGAAGSGMFDVNIGDAAILAGLFGAIFKWFGPFALACAAILASLATVVGLTAGASSFFSRVTKEKLPYKTGVVIICAASLLASILGDDATMRYAVQILTLLYPAAIVLIGFNVIRCCIINRGTFLGGVYAALIVSFLEAFPAVVGPYITSTIRVLPFFIHGLAWITPAIICGILGTIFYYFFGKAKSLNEEAKPT